MACKLRKLVRVLGLCTQGLLSKSVPQSPQQSKSQQQLGVTRTLRVRLESDRPQVSIHGHGSALKTFKMVEQRFNSCYDNQNTGKSRIRYYSDGILILAYE
jgi:hypothetical protein